MRASRARRTKGAIAVLVGVALASMAAASAAGGDARQAPGPPPPRVIQLSYSDVNDGTFPRYRLMAFSRRTDSVDFATRFGGKKASAGARLDKSITDTDIKGNAKHPFVIVRKQGGRRVLKLIRKSLDRRGEAKVRVRAKRDDRVDAIRLKIVLARCSQDPPLFPVDCEVKRSGKHV
jgi:RNA-binding protein YhbY